MEIDRERDRDREKEREFFKKEEPGKMVEIAIHTYRGRCVNRLN